MEFSGKVVVVTGAGRGIGRAVAAGFCADGATVIGIGRTQADLEETARACGGRMVCVTGDVAEGADVARLFAEADRHGGAHVLVNNAALYPKTSLLESTHEEWRRVMDVNVSGMAHCCRVALRGMLARGHGRIVNVGSFAWKGPIPASSAYSASKAAVHVLTRALATEIDRQRYPDILVNELLPGIIRTAMSESGEPPEAVYPHVRTVVRLASGGPTGRTFLRSELYEEDHGLRARLRRLARRALGR
jgi:NAD(P)-dependent dehydrogenase (short-subunit alcohol dehydrogenase family)